MASGFFARALVSMVIWASTPASVAGPSKLLVAPSFAASCSAPFLTACQNRCWKHLDTIAMYGFLPAPPDEVPVPALPDDEPQPLRIRAPPWRSALSDWAVDRGPSGGQSGRGRGMPTHAVR